MNLIVIRKSKNPPGSSGDNLLQFALSHDPIAGLILNVWSKGLDSSPNRRSILRFVARRNSGKTVCAIPEEWAVAPHTTTPIILPYRKDESICLDKLPKGEQEPWFVISNGRLATLIDSELLSWILAGIRAEVVAINAEPQLLPYREKMRLTAQGKVAGFRRRYADSAEPAPVPRDWPHHLFVRTKFLDKALAGGSLPQSFPAFVERCGSNALNLQAINVAGLWIDLETEDGLLGFCSASLSKMRNSIHKIQDSATISPGARLCGKVLLGKNVHIGRDVVIVGPTIICDDVRIGKNSVINSSIIGPEVRVPQNQLVQNRVVKGPHGDWKRLTQSPSRSQLCHPKAYLSHRQRDEDVFRHWSRLSYASLKRVFDLVAAIIVLILFAPITPFIILAIKLTSPGPVFFKDERQGLHGKEFQCLKFRTMHVGAAGLQEKLRVVSQVDGPQFKMEDDPRISTVGRFLRETYIDEIPQFLNVLLGQMSVVGPRPSPESENTLCPAWRDARLSVRPGITGLWQVCCTREPTKDFQEWIYYDTRYVRNLSLRVDLWISWQTAKKMVRKFIGQF
jgi:lipopolysaccharide/colanic/teichoic acid biosynthesis glycosyltransferase/acetyltransferase-like isoleucine patch superfamily enzyme